MTGLAAHAGTTGLPLAVVGVVLFAACAHATWNAIAHDITDKLVAFTLIGLGGVVPAVVVIALSAAPDSRSWPYLWASVGVHVVYNALLMLSYRLGEFSQVYPLARGTSPLVVTVLAAVVVSEVPGPAQIAGVVAVSVGLMSLVFAGGQKRGGRDGDVAIPNARNWPALAAAIGTGLAIATYTTIDGIGVRASGSAAGYTGWLMLLEGLVIPPVALAWRRGRLIRAIRPVWWLGLTGGALSVLAYGLVLWAQTRGALGPVATLRESSIIIGAIIGTAVFKERFGKIRIVATVTVVIGILLIEGPSLHG